ncbi:hypothetical protein Tco_0520207 [Tanacetum coccineum]
MEETFMNGDGSYHISSWYWTYSSIRFHPSSSTLKVLRENFRWIKFPYLTEKAKAQILQDVFTQVIRERMWVPKNRGSTDLTDASDYSNWLEDTLVRAVLQIPLVLTALAHFFITFHKFYESSGNLEFMKVEVSYIGAFGATVRPLILKNGNYIPRESQFRRHLENKGEYEERVLYLITKGPYLRPIITDPDDPNNELPKPISKMTEANKK